MNLCVVAYKFGTEKEVGEHLGFYHFFIEEMRRLVKKGNEVTVVCPYLSFARRGSAEVDGVRVERFWPPLLGVSWAWPLNRIIRYIYFKQTQKTVLRVLAQKKYD